jgi:hypothetical protein
VFPRVVVLVPRSDEEKLWLHILVKEGCDFSF